MKSRIKSRKAWNFGQNHELKGLHNTLYMKVRTKSWAVGYVHKPKGKTLENMTKKTWTEFITWGIPIVPSAFLIGATSTGSQAIGTSAAAKIFWTATAISGPATKVKHNQIIFKNFNLINWGQANLMVVSFIVRFLNPQFN